MNITLTGGTGFVGSSVLDTLVRHGHAVTAIVRSSESAQRVTARGATAAVGDLLDGTWLTARLASTDALIHTASPGDATSAAFDTAVASAAVAAFAGTTKPYIHTGGIWGFGSGAVDETTPLDPPAIVAWRGPIESGLLDSDMALTVLAPAIVYGHGKGIPALIPNAPRTPDGVLTVIGDGEQHWTTVHVDDLAELYRVIVESGRGQGRVLAASGQNPTVRELGEAFSGAPVAAEGASASRARLGDAFADALLLDTTATGEKARGLGWMPVQPSLVDESRDGSYRAVISAAAS